MITLDKLPQTPTDSNIRLMVKVVKKLEPTEKKSERSKRETIVADMTGATKMISYNEIINKKLDNSKEPSLLLLDIINKGTHIIATSRSKAIIASKYLLYYYWYVNIQSI